MVISYQYTYLIGNLIGLAVWTFIFLKRKDLRKEMLTISLIFGLSGPLVQSIYIRDWWQPLTITRTAIGIEDFLFGFITGGILSVIYSFLFNKRIQTKKQKKIRDQKRNINFITILGLTGLILLSGFFLFGLNSLISTTLAFSVPILIIWTRRKDLIKNSLVSGISALIITTIVYHLLNIITPGWIDNFWYFDFVGKIMILGVPLEEHIFYFLAGAFIDPLYEYWKEGKLINAKN